MAQKNRTDLKTYFNTGDTPTEAQFADLIDSEFNPSNDTLDAIPDGSTYKKYTATEQTKLAGIATGANVGVVPNGAITGATKTKVTYDAKGLITSGADATTADIADSSDKRYCTDAQKTVIGNTSGSNTGDQTLPVKATGAEITTGTDDAKFATAKALKDAGVGLSVGYNLPVMCTQLTTVVDAATYYLGQISAALSITNDVRRVYVPKAGAVKSAYIYWYSSTAGTNEDISVYFRLNDSTDTLIATVGTSATQRLFANTALNISVAQGDHFEIKIVCPTWSTNPANLLMSGSIYIE